MTGEKSPPVLARRGSFSISSDKSALDLDAIHSFLTRSYWVPGISKAAVARCVEGADGFGLFEEECQIGFARVITDGVRIGFLTDVYVLEEYQGQGLGAWLLEVILRYPAYETISSWMLMTQDAHSFYEKFGFGLHPHPDRFMSLMSEEKRAALAEG